MSSEDTHTRWLMITGDELKTLVTGGVVIRAGIAVALADIGFEGMRTAIEAAKDRPQGQKPWDVDPEGWEEVLESARKAIEGELEEPA